MNFDPHSFEMDFRPPLQPLMEGPPATLIGVLAEQSIMQAILAGSGGPSNEPMTDEGLRLIRYLMSQAVDGHLPNFKSLEVVRELARRFIAEAGSNVEAIHLMNAIADGIAV